MDKSDGIAADLVIEVRWRREKRIEAKELLAVDNGALGDDDRRRGKFGEVQKRNPKDARSTLEVMVRQGRQ